MHIFLLTYNEEELFTHIYTTEFVNTYFKPNGIEFVVLDNGNQPLMKDWCEQHNYTYYASEYNIGSAGGYNWMFKAAHLMGLDSGIIMQADVEFSSAEPLLFTQRLIDTFGDTHFICWPQEMYGFWLQDESQLRRYEHDIANLGNIVGFNPHILKSKNCYFDENYVVTHFDDVEFLQWIQANNLMKYINAAYLIQDSSNQYYSHDSSNYPTPLNRSFVLETNNYFIKIHHASIEIDRQNKGIADSHSPWEEFNKPYYEVVLQRGLNRLGYDSTRWTQFGYPKYPIEHELKRFAEQNPGLVKNTELIKTLTN